MKKEVGVARFSVENLKVTVAPGRDRVGKEAAVNVAQRVQNLLKNQDFVRIVFAAAPSQDQFLSELCDTDGIEWKRVCAFHMDEYIGLGPNAPQLFGRYLDEHIFSKVPFKSVYKIDSQAGDYGEECVRYSNLLTEKPIDIVCMGIGENGHIAFNDPPVADFKDQKVVKVVELDKECRKQQVHDGCFESFEKVPARAFTLTVPTLMSARHLSIVVPGSRKAAAVERTLTGEMDERCPASILRTHPDAFLFLDRDSASEIDYR